MILCCRFKNLQKLTHWATHSAGHRPRPTPRGIVWVVCVCNEVCNFIVGKTATVGVIKLRQQTRNDSWILPLHSRGGSTPQWGAGRHLQCLALLILCIITLLMLFNVQVYLFYYLGQVATRYCNAVNMNRLYRVRHGLRLGLFYTNSRCFYFCAALLSVIQSVD